jgi:hypothetical protein
LMGGSVIPCTRTPGTAGPPAGTAGPAAGEERGGRPDGTNSGAGEGEKTGPGFGGSDGATGPDGETLL